MRVPQWYCLLSEAQRGLLLDKGIPYWKEICKNILIKRKNMILNGTVKPKNTYVVWVCKIFTILDPNRQLEVLFVFQMSCYDKWAMNHHPAVNKTRFWSWGLAANMHRRNVGVCYKSKNLANHSPKYKKQWTVSFWVFMAWFFVNAWQFTYKSADTFLFFIILFFSSVPLKRHHFMHQGSVILF